MNHTQGYWMIPFHEQLQTCLRALPGTAAPQNGWLPLTAQSRHRACQGPHWANRINLSMISIDCLCFLYLTQSRKINHVFLEAKYFQKTETSEPVSFCVINAAGVKLKPNDAIDAWIQHVQSVLCWMVARGREAFHCFNSWNPNLARAGKKRWGATWCNSPKSDERSLCPGHSRGTRRSNRARCRRTTGATADDAAQYVMFPGVWCKTVQDLRTKMTKDTRHDAGHKWSKACKARTSSVSTLQSRDILVASRL